MEKYTYATLLSTDDYVWGVLGLYYSLQKVNSKYPLLVMVTDNIKPETIDILEDVGVSYKIVNNTLFSKSAETEELKLYAKRYKSTFNKFHVYNLKGYDKVLFLDADILTVGNIDNMFDYNAPAYFILDNTLISGTYFLINPKDREYEYYLQFLDTCYTDEDIFTEDCNIDSINKMNENSFIFHLSNDLTSNQKYWKYFGLDNCEKIKSFIDEN